jgi:nitrogen regulatory protein PII
VEETLDQIATVARTGRMGDGKAFVLSGLTAEAALGIG